MSLDRFSRDFTPEIRKQLGLLKRDTEEVVTYSSEPIGQPDPSLIHTGKIFRRTKLEDKLSPRDIVLTDLGLSYQINTEHSHAILEPLWLLLSKLITAGHRLFVWQSNHAVPISSKKDFQLACYNITPGSSDTIKKYFSSQKIRSDDIFILDYFSLTELKNEIINQFPVLSEAVGITSYLIGDFFCIKNTINFSSFRGMDEKTFDQALDSFQGKTIETVILQNNYPLAEIFYAKFFRRYPEVKNTACYTSYFIPDHIIKKYKLIVKHLKIDAHAISEIKKIDITHLETLQLQNTEQSKLTRDQIHDLFTLFNTAKKLTQLKLHLFSKGTNIHDALPSLALTSKNTLKKLEFTGEGNLSLSILTLLLNQHAETLEILNLSLSSFDYKKGTLQSALPRLRQFVFQPIDEPSNEDPNAAEITSDILSLSRNLEILSSNVELDEKIVKTLSQTLLNLKLIWDSEKEYKLLATAQTKISNDIIGQYETRYFTDIILPDNISGPASFIDPSITEITISGTHAKHRASHVIEYVSKHFLKLKHLIINIPKLTELPIEPSSPNISLIESIEINCYEINILNILFLCREVPNLKSLKIVGTLVGNFPLFSVIASVYNFTLQHLHLHTICHDKNFGDFLYLLVIKNQLTTLYVNNPTPAHGKIPTPIFGQYENAVIPHLKKIRRLYFNGSWDFVNKLCQEVPHALEHLGTIHYNVTNSIATLPPEAVTAQTFSDEKNQPTYQVDNYFHPKSESIPIPTPGQIREKIFPELKITPTHLLKNAVLPTDLKEINIQTLSATQFNQAIDALKSNASLYCMTVTKPISHTPQMIPIVNINDRISAMVLNEHLHVEYSSEFKAYFVRLTDETPYQSEIHSLNYILEIKPEPSSWPLDKTMTRPNTDSVFQHLTLKINPEGKEQLVPDSDWKNQFDTVTHQDATVASLVAELIAYSLKFSPKGRANLEGLALFNYMMRNAAENCEHRCFVVKKILDVIGITCHIEGNSPHAFIKVKIGNNFHKIDLGGTAATINLTAAPTPIVIEPDSRILSLNSLSETFDQKEVTHYSDFKPYISDFISKIEKRPPHQRQGLLFMNSPDEIMRFHSAMFHFTKHSNKKYMLIDDFSKVRFQLFRVEKSNGSYSYIPSTLIKKIMNASPGDIFVVNWSAFKPEHIGHNSILDDTRTFDSTLIPLGVIIINLLTSRERDLMSEDFYSRNKVFDDFPRDIPLPHPIIESKELPKEKKLFPVHCFDEAYWEKHLLGLIEIKNKKFKIEESAILKAIEQKFDGIEIVNPPKHSRELMLTLTEMIQLGTFDCNGDHHILPPEFLVKISHHEYTLLGPYTIEILNDQNRYNWQEALNNDTFNYFFRMHTSTENRLDTLIGILEQNKNKRIELLVTSRLTTGQWTQLFTEAERVNCKLHLIIPQDNLVPEKMLLKKIQHIVDNTNDVKMQSKDYKKESVLVIETNDIDFTALTYTTPETAVISIHEDHEFSEVWECIEAINLDQKNHEIIYKNIIGSIWKEWLAQGKTVILKGRFSDSLAARMENLFSKVPHLILNGKSEPLIKGRLIIITDQKNRFIGSTAKQEIVTPENYIKPLLANGFKQTDIDRLKTINAALPLNHKLTSFTEYKTVLHEQKMLPYRNPLRSRALLAKEPQQLATIKKFYPTPIKLDTKENNILKRRFNKMIGMLAHSPFVFIIGPSGSGKSTAIISELKTYFKLEKKQELKSFFGKEQIEAWAKQTDPGYPTILFIDEANLEKEGTFEIFEGLYNNPPGILLNGKFLPILPHQKIIFAGNQSHYEGRLQHRFFQRHGSIMSFNEWPKEYLATTMVMPVLKELFDNKVYLETMVKQVADQFVTQYLGFKKLWPEYLLTPRNLQSMCFHFAQLIQSKTVTQLDYAINLTFFNEVSSFLTPQDEKSVIEKFKINALQSKIEKEATQEFKSADYLPVPSRNSLFTRLSIDFKTRDMKCKNPKLGQYGTRGILLEGGSGVGKSSAAIAWLKANGYVQVTADNKDTPEIKAKEAENKVYCHLTPSRPEKMIALLHEGFDRGWVFPIDEINTGSVEKTVNELMMGKKKGKPPLKEGCFFIATQNNANLANRKFLSPALENRFHKICLKEYDDHELSLLAAFKQCPENKIPGLIAEFRSRQKRSNIPLTTRYFIDDLVMPEIIKPDIKENTKTASNKRFLLTSPDAKDDKLKSRDEQPVQKKFRP